MTGEELQPFFNISLNSGALPRVLGEKLTEEEYALLSERVQAAIEAAYDAGVEAERKYAIALCEYWAGEWNEIYKSSKNKIAYHQIGTAVWSIGKKIADHELLP